jgi:hypothetical protein
LHFFLQIPVQYLDSAHDKAVEFIEDVQAIFFAPFTDDDDDVLNEEDQSSSNVITESSPTSSETELVGPNTEASTTASLINVENSSTGCVDTDAHGTESFSSSKSTSLSLMNHVCPENTSSEGAHIEANDPCLLPGAEGISPREICGTNFSNRRSIFYLSTYCRLTSCFSVSFSHLPPLSDSSEEVILWNPVKLRPRGSCFLMRLPQPFSIDTVNFYIIICLQDYT